MNLTIAPKLVFVFLIINCAYATAQVGINTTTPNGILDVTSTTNGVVLPRLALSSRAIQAPATNPKSGVTVIPNGTIVYNTNTTTMGTNNDVTPGIYAWNSTQLKWIAQFPRKQYVLKNSVIDIRTTNAANTSIIASTSFTTKYTGYYKVKVSVNYGGGNAIVPKLNGPSSGQSNGSLNIARQSGTFAFTFNGTTYTIPATTFSTAYIGNTGTNYFAIWQQFSRVFYLPITANTALNYDLKFSQNIGTEFLNNGNSGDGRGYVGYDIPCSVEITYMGDL